MSLLAALIAVLPQIQDPAPGIEQTLAQARAALVRDVHCALAFRLDDGGKDVAGQATLRFSLPDPLPKAPLVLDFAGTLDGMLVNGAAPGEAMTAVGNHLVLAPALLRAGANEITATFRSAVAATGTPLTVYRDAADGRSYYYTLVVPADAHRLYPCFDQPDIKSVFELELDLPAEWTAIGNGREVEVTAAAEARRRWRFAATKPLPTYLFAFACGPFTVLTGPELGAKGIDGNAPLRVLVRGNQLAHLDLPAIGKLHDAGLRWLAEHFGVEYPFGKLDVALLPGFPYGGMEHAGAIFYREQAMVFDHPPTDAELVRRSTLVYHELSHQWFGNLVTMRWFDDLWLKEGFATFIAHQMLDELEPQRLSWLRFLQHIKPRAYEVDATAGTTPVWQALGNLADAKSAYGAIVYNKAPAVLRELHERLGAAAFRVGLRSYLEQHAFGNATWQDLTAALTASTHEDLARWSERWLQAAAMPQVRIGWQLDDNGIVRSATLQQKATSGEGSWPLQLDLLVVNLAGGRRTVTVRSDAEVVPIVDLLGRAPPACVLANPGDVAYGQFVPDAQSREWLLAHVVGEADPLLRAVMVSALFEAVRQVELDPARFAAVALDLLLNERDAETHGWLLESLGTCLQRYLREERAAPLRRRAAELLLGQLRDEGRSGRELQTFRFLARTVADHEVLALCRSVATFGALPAGLEPGRQDRFLAAAALLAAGVANGEVERLSARFAKEDPAKEAFIARAAAPDAAVKAEYWSQYLQLSAPPEQWTQDSLGWFHWPGQEALTLPYLQLALEQVDWVKQNRRIFFMPAWIDAFVNGHNGEDALAVVRAFLAGKLTPDVRRKVLQSVDGLERAVRIRAAWR